MRRVKVLVVDDSIMFRKMLSEFLDEDPGDRSRCHGGRSISGKRYDNQI